MLGLSRLEVEAIAALLLAAALAIGLHFYDAHQQSIGALQVEADQSRRALAASIANQAVSAQRVAAIQEQAHAADLAASAARADADAARSADQRLRQRLAALSRARSADPAASTASPAAAAPGLVPDDVFGRIDDAAGQLGEYADQLRASLDACIGAYRSLK